MKHKKQFLLWLAVLAWMGLIFYFSAQTATASSGQSGRLIRLFLRWLDSSMSDAAMEARVELLQHAVRKLAHMSIYAVLGMLCMSALLSHRMRDVLRPPLALGISALYAISDEFHQTFIPGRSGEVRDVLIDSSGALIGILLIWLLAVIIKRTKTKPRI